MVDEQPGYSLHGRVGLVRFGRAPLNTLSLEMRRDLAAAIDEALTDDRARAIVVTGIGRGFCAGAQITEFNTPSIVEWPTAHDIWASIEEARKPVVAAIHRLAMGGGLEFAQACHYRVSTPDARLAQPEVKLGLIPGAGGTQRLPRAVGVEKALDMMMRGDAVVAADVEGTRLVDRVARDVVAAAMELADSVADRRPLARLRDLPLPAVDPGLFEAVRDRLRKEQPGYEAPLVIVDCVEAATRLPFDEALRYERARFQEVVNAAESWALRRAFFGVRQLGKRAGADERARDIASRLEPFRADQGRLMAEALRLLAAKPELTELEIDMACLAHLDFPRHLGGPLFHANRTGFDRAAIDTGACE
jgi:3-hydroxyacyl-CoA dehydrogenase